VVSPGPSEGLWYTARLTLIDLGAGDPRESYKPQDQLGWPAAAPSGKYLAIVEALCSDRWFVAGDLRLIETRSGTLQRVDTRGNEYLLPRWSRRHAARKHAARRVFGPCGGSRRRLS
jgi:hypothetical protein